MEQLTEVFHALRTVSDAPFSAPLHRLAGTTTAEAALWVREAAALTVARGVATAMEVAGEIALTAVRPEHGVLPACTFALQGLDDLPVFELRVCEAHARCAARMVAVPVLDGWRMCLVERSGSAGLYVGELLV